MDGIVLAVVSLMAFSFFVNLGYENLSDKTKGSYETQRTQTIPPENIQNGIDRLKKITWIKDVFYDASTLIKWNIGVLSDGRSILWAGSAICSMLEQEKAILGRDSIRLVDIEKVANGTFYKDASLAIIDCESL